MMKWTQRRQAFRGILDGARCIVPASIYDPVSARLAKEVGYEALFLASSGAALATIGGPDEAVLTLGEMAGLTMRINRASTLPLLVDADTGYGNALNVMRTVEELEIAGAAAIKLEDTVAPGRYGAFGQSTLLPLDEATDKIRAALAARSDPDMAIIARTPASSLSGIEEMVKRIVAFQEAGADGVFLIGLRTRAELDAASQAAKVPILTGARSRELADDDYLIARGVRINHLGNIALEAAMVAVRDTLKDVLAHGIDGARHGEPGLFKTVSRQARYQEWARRFLAS